MRFFIAFFIFFTLHLYAKDEIRFGVYAFRGYEDTKKKYEPLVAYLNETLDKKVILEVLSQDEMNKKIAAKELDIVTTSPIHFLVIRQQHQLSGAVATLVAMYENAHTDKFAGVMVVRGDSSIKTLKDIKGKTIAAPNVNALFLLNPNSEYAKASQIYGYTLAADYLETEELTRELRLPPFDKAPQITLKDIWNRYEYVLLLLLAALLLALAFYIQIQRKKRFAESLLTNMGEGVYGVDENGKCTWINQKALDMLGFDKDEVLYKNQHELFHHHKENMQVYEQHECPVYQTIQDKQSRESQEHFIRKDGSFFPIELSVSSIQGDGAIVIFRDITEKKIFQNALLEEKKKAEEANSAKSEFLASMSHEIRTPMNAILGLNKMMFDTGLNEKQRDLVTKIEGSSQMLLSIINDILDYSKIEANKLELENVSFDLESLFSQLKVMFSATALHKELELYFHIKNGVPNLVISDKLRLSQVLTNLLSNALKFTHHGTIILSIELQEKRDENHALLAFSLSDSGIGMSEVQLKKLFTPFTQADSSTTRKYGGTGLGLTISKRIVEAMGGTLSVSSKEGVGTTFSFAIEVEVASWDFMVSIEDNELNKVLIVDDQEISREILKDILLRFGCVCDEAKNGKEALEMIKKADMQGKPYKIILMDWLMPELDGKETIRQIHEMIQKGELHSKTPTILMVSAHAQHKVSPFDVEIEGFLSKPITSSTLFNALSNAKNPHFKKQELPEVQELPDFSGITVLLVEDNEINQEVASMMLQRVGIEVEIANNGKEGVEKYLSNPNGYALIFMDLHMPLMNGYEAAKEIRIHDKSIPIIALSAAALLEDVQRAKESGMDTHLSKPIDIDELYKTISVYTNTKPAIKRQHPLQMVEDTVQDAVLDIEFLTKNFSSQKLVYKLLGKFLQKLESEFSDIVSLLEQQDAATPSLIHALKGVSGNLRANELFAISQTIDTKLKANEKIAQKELDELTNALERVKNTLATLPLYEEEEIAFEKLDKDALKKLFFEIQDALSNGNIIKTIQYKTLVANLREIVSREELDSFSALMDDLEYDSALEILERWKIEA